MRNVDTVEELTDILTSHQTRLMNESSRSGDVFQIGTFNNKLILNFGSSDGAALEHVNDTNDLLTDVVTDLNALTTLGDVSVDGKVCVHQTKLVLILLSQTGEHVVDVRTDSSDRSAGLGVTEPHFALDLTTEVDELKIDRDVLEVLDELAVLTGNSDNTGVDLYLDVSGHVDELFGDNLLHNNRRV